MATQEEILRNLYQQSYLDENSDPMSTEEYIQMMNQFMNLYDLDKNSKQYMNH